MNFDDSYQEGVEEVRHVKAKWIELNMRGTETIQDIFQAKYMQYASLLWFGTNLIVICLTEGTILTIRECDPLLKMRETSDWNKLPFPILMSIFFMVGGLHSIMLPEIKACLDMMKFALNHPNRFHSWFRAFATGFLRMIMLIFIEIVNCFRLLGRCDVTLNVIGFITFTGLIDLDMYCFSSLNYDLPFKRIVTGGADSLPD